MKKVIAFLLALSLLLCFTSCATYEIEESTTINETIESVKTEISTNIPDTTINIPEITESIKDEQNEKFSFLSIYLGKKHIEKKDDKTGKVFSEIDYQTLHMNDEDSKKYPRLVKSLESLNGEVEADSISVSKEFEDIYAEDSERFKNSDFIPFSSEKVYTIQRADNIILSVRLDKDEFYSGPYPIWGVESYNFNVETGTRLSVADVVTDISKFTDAIAEKLAEMRDSLDEGLSENIDEWCSQLSPDEFCWTMNYQALTVYFNSGEIASRSVGVIALAVFFDEYPELFNEKYMKAPNAYAVKLPDCQDVAFDMNSYDSKTDIISVSRNNYDNEAFKQIAIVLNGKEFLIDKVTHTFDSYLVYEKGNFFVYILPEAEYVPNTEVLICDLKTGKTLKSRYIKETDIDKSYCGYEFFFNDPMKFIL